MCIWCVLICPDIEFWIWPISAAGTAADARGEERQTEEDEAEAGAPDVEWRLKNNVKQLAVRVKQLQADKTNAEKEHKKMVRGIERMSNDFIRMYLC